MKQICFSITDREFAESESYPVPSSTVIPDWYRQASGQSHKTAPVVDGRLSLNMKSCVPFLDALTAGYMKLLPTDLLIRNHGHSVEYYCPNHKIISNRAETNLPPVTGFLHHEFVWHTYAWPRTPPGYSCLITHPFNRYDLPFLTMTGIVDTDTFGALDGGGNLPFMLREDFDGIIPAGTPIYQVIPFKRDNWEHDTGLTPLTYASEIRNKVRRHFNGAYKRYFWSKKTYR